jgi:L-2-hydroxyglutarate oxidase LhgO
VATNNEEAAQLNELYQRGLQNNVPGLRLVEAHEIKQIEPNCVVSNYEHHEKYYKASTINFLKGC